MFELNPFEFYIAARSFLIYLQKKAYSLFLGPWAVPCIRPEGCAAVEGSFSDLLNPMVLIQVSV